MFAAELCGGALGLEDTTLGVDDVEIVDEAAAVALLGERGGVAGAGELATHGFRLARQCGEIGEGVLDFAEGVNLIAVVAYNHEATRTISLASPRGFETERRFRTKSRVDTDLVNG